MTTRVLDAGLFDGVGCVGLTFADDGELDPAELGRWARDHGVRTCYPVVDGPTMKFVEWDGVRPTTTGPFGLTQPPDGPPVPAEVIDLVLVPLVLFGPQGARAGRGAGYFDRTFSFLAAGSRPSRPALVGLAHDFQEDPALIGREWDVPLDVIVTPSRLLRAS